MTQTPRLLVVGVGGLGAAMVREAHERRAHVSVLVRDRTKLDTALDDAALARIDRIEVGDGADAPTLDTALAGVDVVLSGRGADPRLAEALASAVSRSGARKLCWPAGSTNVLADDGVTPNYVALRDLGPWVAQAYRTHQECIDAIRATGITSVIFCPGRMAAVGHRTPDVAASVRIDRDAGQFVSYEDAAWVMVEGALSDVYDGQLVSASTPTG